MLLLPKYIQFSILKFLSKKDLKTFSLVCSHFRNLVQDCKFWSFLISLEFPTLLPLQPSTLSAREYYYRIQRSGTIENSCEYPEFDSTVSKKIPHISAFKHGYDRWYVIDAAGFLYYSQGSNHYYVRGRGFQYRFGMQLNKNPIIELTKVENIPRIQDLDFTVDHDFILTFDHKLYRGSLSKKQPFKFLAKNIKSIRGSAGILYYITLDGDLYYDNKPFTHLASQVTAANIVSNITTAYYDYSPCVLVFAKSDTIYWFNGKDVNILCQLDRPIIGIYPAFENLVCIDSDYVGHTLKLKCHGNEQSLYRVDAEIGDKLCNVREIITSRGWLMYFIDRDYNLYKSNWYCDPQQYHLIDKSYYGYNFKYIKPCETNTQIS